MLDDRDAVSPIPEENDEDCYFDGPYLVFTAAYHLKRGFCCQSRCRHCPFGCGKDGAALAAKEEI
ncbi:MAG: DUF5522 domain-containing protein [Acidobacteriaceae bacterium]